LGRRASWTGRDPLLQDDDPLNVTDCEDGSTQDTIVRAAELQVFRR
jgi:hypothetical protein